MPTRSEARPPVVLPPLTAAAAAAVLAPPRLPAEVTSVPLACRAAAGAIPVLLRAPAAAGRLLLARALHALAGREGSLVVATGRRPPLDRVPAGSALYLDVAALAPDGALALEALLAAPPRRAADALDRLVAHAWPGDLAELEAVLARALLLAGGVVEAAHLDLAAEPPAAVAAAPATAPGDAALEYLLAELAHELRNPLVTIKTFADHLPALLEDAELRARFATLTSEAIERMDGLLENVLAFARLGAPRREAVE